MAIMKKNTNSSSWTIPSFTLMTNALRIMTAVKQPTAFAAQSF
jgi:hypothetical protein